jgi:hypothetical protein
MEWPSPCCDYLKGLRKVSDAAFHEGEYAA